MNRDKPNKKKLPLKKDRRKTRLLQRTREVSALLAVAEVATQSLNAQKILSDTLDKSLEILRFNLGYIRIFDPEARGLVIRIARGLSSPQFLAHVVRLDSSHRSISQMIFETRKAVIVPDVRRDARFQHAFMAQEGLVSALFVPVMSKNRVLGLMMVGSPKAHKFTERDINLLEVFGLQLGAALENAQLYDEVSKGKTYIENLLENAGDAIVSTDTKDRVLTWNRAAEIILGYSKEEMIGKKFSILLPKGSIQEFEGVRRKVLNSGTIRDIESPGKRKDGAKIYLSLSVSPICDVEGKIIGFLRIAKDITEKKRYEGRLKELDRMKSDFVSNVSHELRTPLTAIKGSVDNMLDGLTGSLNEKQVRYLGRVKSNTDRLARLINDLLDLSRIEAGRIEVRPTVVSLSSVIEEAIEQLKPLAAAKVIQIAVTPTNLDELAWADRDKLTQVLLNLVGNAIKFTPEEGTVTVAVKKNCSQRVDISVADTGPGIAPEERDKIFAKFYQIANSDNQRPKGSGLGLAISKALVEMLGGEMWVESILGKGSTFSFTLPAHQPSAIEVPA